jgi:hypothetical protein
MEGWTEALSKAQADLMRQWTDMNAAWARAMPAATAGASRGATAGAADGLPGGGEIAQRFLQQCEQYLGVSRSLWDLLGRAAAAPEAEQRSKLFGEGLGPLQQQFAALWAATPFAAPFAAAGAGGNPFAALAGGMPGAGAFNPFAPFNAGASGAMPGMGAAPGLGGLDALFNVPALGPAREQQQAWQRLAQLAARYGQAQFNVVQQWNDIIGKSLESLAERLAPALKSGATPGSMKEVYDLWVESAEGVYAQVARGASFVQAQAELTNALSQLRSAQRELVEEWSKQFDLPTRAELNSIHQQLRDLKAALQR